MRRKIALIICFLLLLAAVLPAGMNAHLSKPVEADQLIRTLGELIYEARQNGE